MRKDTGDRWPEPEAVLGRRERAAIVLAAVVLAVFFFVATRTNYYTLQLDSAYLVESIETTYHFHVPLTQLTKSVIHGIQTVLTASPATVCRQPLVADQTPLLNIFERHSFPILYGLAFCRFFFEAKYVVFFFQVLAFPGLLVAIYIILRRQAVGVAASLAFVLLVAAHPAWSYAAFGQPYPDKYFPLFGLIYLYLLRNRLLSASFRTRWIVLFALLSISTTERAAIMLAAGTLGGLLLHRGLRGWRRQDILVLGIGATAAVYAVLYISRFQKNLDYSSFYGSVASFFDLLKTRPDLVDSIGKFLFVNLSSLGLLSVPEWRFGLLAAGAMLPNIVGFIGGAEKLGWTTHYHSCYFPFLVFAALLGFVRLDRLLRARGLGAVSAGIPCAIAVLLLALNPFTPSPLFDFEWKNVREAGLVKMLELNTGTGPSGSIVARSRALRRMAAAVPANAELTTVEGYMPALYIPTRRIHFYPLGLGSVEYAVLPCSRAPSGEWRYSGAVSYLGREAEQALNECLTARLSQCYRMVGRFPDGSGSQEIAILKRVECVVGANRSRQTWENAE